MPTEREPSARHGIFVAIAALIGVFATTPGQTVGVSAFIDPIASDLGLDRAHVLVLYSLGTFLGILTAPFIGRLIDRFGPRRLIVPAVVAVAAACGVMSLAHDAWSLGAGFLVLRAAAIAGLSLVTMQMVNLWFDRFRGRVTALAMMGLALGGLVIPPLIELIIQGPGWRTAYLVLAAGLLAVMLPVGLAFYRNRPEEHGADRDFGRASAGATAMPAISLTLAESLRTNAFWYFSGLTVLSNGVGTALMLDHVRAMAEAGLTRDSAIGLLGAMTTTQAIATLCSGTLIDRFGARPVGLLGLCLLAFAVTCLWMSPAFAGGLAYAVALGAMIGTLQIVYSAGLAESFGLKYLGTIRGTLFVIGVSGAAAGPLAFLWSPAAAYSIFLGITVAAATLGLVGMQFRARGT
ncbi:MAG: MFS transporter [Reyranella sp.]|uniref:MFS transporter n=1 Tax=Reyranella sp. TaxID=1929291 RepID=UPI002730F995|nr:MFS transporter [Reyranella sp.]MDP1965736.1 MFS transporter [Reyranella sp.]MDP2372270.1 MFS transporter [Reyranella sp.]